MNTQPNFEKPTNPNTTLTRRKLLIGIGAGAAAYMLSPGFTKAGETRHGNIDPSPEAPATPDQNNDSLKDEGETTPDTLRRIAESDPDKLSEEFQITTEQASTPELFAEEYAKRLELALNAGCTPEEVAYYLETGDRGYEDEMGDKYDLAAVKGMYGFGPDATDEDVKSTPQYELFALAHKATLTRYLYASNVGITSQSVAVSPVMELIDKGESNGKHYMTINLNVTDHYGEMMPGNTSYDITAPVSLGVDFSTDSGICEVSMDPTVRVLFDQIAE